jgi:BirA family biotin operon repressor/biotin-[acetyl-CoA-carboxylase] ligase
LVEASLAGERASEVVIGIGLNVNRTEWPPELDGRATSLRLTHPTRREFDRAEAFACVLGAVETWVQRFVQDGPSALVGPLDARLAFKGREVRCEDVAGILVGVAASGAARIATAQGVREVVAGTLRPIDLVARNAAGAT